MRTLWFEATLIFSLFSGEAQLFAKAKPSFANMQKNVLCQPSSVVRPMTEAELQEAVQGALRKGLPIKAANQGWKGSNASSCVSPGGVQIDTSGLDRILAVDTERNEVRVQPGIKLWDFTQALHRDYQLTLTAVQEYADVTLGGMLGNSTHGSSLQEESSSLSDRIVALRVIDGQGEVREIRGKDLDYFGGHLGVLGIISELTVKVQPSFKVKAAIAASPDTHLEDEILPFVETHYAAAVTWFPGQSTYTTAAYDKVSQTLEGEAHNGQTEKPWLQRTLFPPIFKAAHLGNDNKLMCLLENERMKMKSQSFFTERYGNTVDPAIGWAHEMLSFVCRDRCPFDALPYVLEEIAIPLEALPRFIEQAKTLFAQKKVCLPLNGIYFRFGRASRGALAMASGRDTAYVGMEYVRNPYGNHYPKDFEFIQELEQILLKDYKGRPHWGKNAAAMFRTPEERYPRWDEFTAYRDQLDPQGIFKNEWFRTLQGELKSKAPTPNCVANEACYCSADEHCPRTYSCQAGLIDPNVRVCRKHP